MTDIIIPAYHAQGSIVRLLNSIACQQCLDQFTVTIVNDSADGDTYADVLKLFPYLQVTELSYAANRGPGYARQYGIDHTSGDYIMFIDADDWLFDCMALYNIVYTVDYNTNIFAYNIVLWNNTFCELTRTTDRWLHGKVFKRSFLQEHNIKFQKLYYGEDTLFMQQCKCYTHIQSIPARVYTYNFTPHNSLTHNCMDPAVSRLSLIHSSIQMFNSIHDCNEYYKRTQIHETLHDTYMYYTMWTLAGVQLTAEYTQELHTALHELVKQFPDDYDWEANKGQSEENIFILLQQNNIQLQELPLTFAKFMDNVIHLQVV